ncbi:serine protease [Pseudonocardia acaciae]|uniref:serine protease n=1 Tax=Pseudonocardia acaciae TaxID=551276 RepID=UPI00048E1049|nr:serine protease [Pseudonocardia acaciae]
MEAVDQVVVERGGVGLAATACVRVRDAGGDVVGSGFLIGPDLVATCAHVVASAIGADMFAEATPERPVLVDFPMLAGAAAARSARVHRWVPVAEDGTGDVALLRLTASAPAGAVMPPVRRVEGLWDHHFRAFGFPAGRWDGVWATGRIRGGQATGWFQLQGNPGEAAIEGGFSGSPVWDDESGAVVGMTVAADRDPSVTTAYLIPIEQVLGLDPELLPCPYRGLEPFDEEHAEYFFGREPELRRLRAAVEASPLVVVDGPSGAGKSSLARAGLLPALRADGVAVERVEPRPGLPVLVDTAGAVLRLADPGSSAARQARDSDRIGAALGDPAGRAQALDELADALAGGDAQRLVLFVDQFEELSEATPEAACELLGLLAELAARGGATGPLRIVLTARGLALHEALTPAVADALGSGTVLVGPMDRARLREAIVRPAERAPGLGFDDGLVDRILDDAGTEPGQLPLVESLLAQLWARREGGALTNAGYRAAGGVAGALAAHAEKVTAELPGEKLRALCTRLAVPGRDGRFVRKPVRYADLPPELRELAPPLVAGRLVVVAGSSGSGGTGGTVELAHQALIEHWPRLRDWLAADREFLAWRAQLDNDRQRWESTGRDDGALPRGAALTAADAWTDRAGELTDAQSDFLHRARQRHRRDARRTRIIAAAVAALVLIAGTLTVVAVRTTGRNTVQQATANAETLAREATARATDDPVLAAQLALAAWRSDPNNPAARTALAGQYLALGAADTVVTGAPGDKPVLIVSTSATAPHDNLLLTTGEDDLTAVTDPSGPNPQRLPLPAPTGAFGKDGTRFYYVDGDGAVRVTDVRPGATPTQLAAPTTPRPTLAGRSPNGERIGWWSRDQAGRSALTVHDLATGATRTVPISLPSDEVKLALTDDPDRVRVTIGASTDPTPRFTVRSLARDAEVYSAPPGTSVVNNGTAVLGCTPADPTVTLSRASLAVTDITSGARTREIPLALLTTCQNYRITTDNRYLVEDLTFGAGTAQRLWRATELSSGRAYVFTSPPMNTSAWPPRLAPWITLTTRPDGATTAFIATGPTVVRVPVHRDAPLTGGNGGPTPTRSLLADGQVLLATQKDGSLTSYDRASGETLATRPTPPRDPELDVPDDDLWSPSQTPASWELVRYQPRTLAPATRLTLPGGPTAPPNERGAQGVNFALGRMPGGPPTTVTALVGGVLSAWDATTGQPLGAPINLAAQATKPEFYRDHAGIWPRVGHPTQALVATPEDGMQLWDVPAGRMLAEMKIPITGRYSIAARGDRLAALTRTAGVETWDLPTGKRTDSGLNPGDVMSLWGFTAEGHLITTHYPNQGNSSPESITLFDLDRRAASGTLVPAVFGEFTGVSTTLGITGYNDRAPAAVALTAREWRDSLCRLVPGELSPAARRLLPDGVDPGPPCR